MIKPVSTQHGGCQCGAVRFATTESPVRAMACHCTTCKLRSGSPYGVGVYFNEDDVTMNQVDLGSYQFKSDTTGRWIRNEFCLNCGSAVSWTLEMRPGLRAIAGGAYDNPSWFAIDAHIWTRSARQDMCYPSDMPVHEEGLK